MAKDSTTIEISRENWKRLNQQKGPGDSFDDALGRVLDLVEDGDPFSGETDDRRHPQGDTSGDEIECGDCGHVWEYGGTMARATCPSCGGKVPVE